MTNSSVVEYEVEQFAAHAGSWWDPDGPEAMLHKLNPVRLQYIRDQVNRHWQVAETESVLGAAIAAQGRWAEARELLDRAYKVLLAQHGPSDEVTVEARARLGR